jgi:hypothetical protein
MQRAIDLTGTEAINFLVARAMPKLVKLWDGDMQRIAFIAQVEETLLTTGFWTREHAVEVLRVMTSRNEGPRYGTPAQRRDVAEIIQAGPRPGVQCLVLGWDACVLLEIEPDDFGAVSSVVTSVSNEEIADLFDDCGTSVGAARHVTAAREALATRGLRVVELEQLEHLVAARWEDVAAISLAILKARAEVNHHIQTAEGQRAVLVLELLVEVTSKRAFPLINAPGGGAGTLH